MYDRTMTKTEYQRLLRRIKMVRHCMLCDMRDAEHADSPGWAATQIGRRANYNLSLLLGKMPQSRPDTWGDFYHRQAIRRHEVLTMLIERRRKALLESARLPDETLIDCVSRRCGFVKDANFA
jgi:hypothetical protein